MVCAYCQATLPADKVARVCPGCGKNPLGTVTRPIDRPAPPPRQGPPPGLQTHVLTTLYGAIRHSRRFKGSWELWYMPDQRIGVATLIVGRPASHNAPEQYLTVYQGEEFIVDSRTMAAWYLAQKLKLAGHPEAEIDLCWAFALAPMWRWTPRRRPRRWWRR